MNDRVQEQLDICDELVSEMQADGIEIDLAMLLDYLAICGFKLKRCVPSDFDPQGVSVASHAYFSLLKEED